MTLQTCGDVDVNDPDSCESIYGDGCKLFSISTKTLPMSFQNLYFFNISSDNDVGAHTPCVFRANHLFTREDKEKPGEHTAFSLTYIIDYFVLN